VFHASHCRAVCELLKAAIVIRFHRRAGLEASVACPSPISFINLPPLKCSIDGTPAFAPRGESSHQDREAASGDPGLPLAFDAAEKGQRKRSKLKFSTVVACW
jgi:hypothetical protein